MENYIFKKVSNTEKIEDIKTYLKEFLKVNSKAKIAVGSDSLRHRGRTVYATIIALFYPSVGENGVIEFHKGAHLIYVKKIITGKMDLWTRLWNEVEMTREVAEFIDQEVLENTKWEKEVEIHLDINPDVQWESNKLFASAVGLFEGMGYPVMVKPDGWVASCAADNLVR